MPELYVETGQNVFIKKDLANVGERIVAQLIDFVVMFSYALFVIWIINIISKSMGIKLEALIIVLLFPLFFYSLLSEVFLQGQSLGKKILKTKVVKLSGGQPTIGSYIIRWMFRLIDVNFFYGAVAIITISANGRGQRVGDLVAKTSVVSLKRKESLKNTIFVELDDDYMLVYPEADLLDVSDIKTIKDVVSHYKKSVTKPISIDMVKNTADAIKQKVNITSKEVPLLFLETILKDYNYINRVKS